MKMMVGWLARATANKARTSFSPSPTWVGGAGEGRQGHMTNSYITRVYNRKLNACGVTVLQGRGARGRGHRGGACRGRGHMGGVHMVHHRLQHILTVG